MDAAWWMAVAAGTVLGAFALVPGLHVNTLAALLLAAGAATWGHEAAALLVAAAVSHAFFAVLPATYVGVPSDETAISVLPAQRLAREGRGREAVAVAVAAVMLATLAAIALLWPAKWLLGEPVQAARRVGDALPWLLAAVLAVLALSERRTSYRAVGAALGIQAAAGALGYLVLQIRMQGLVPVPQAPLMPLLSGLFGAAGLVASLLHPSWLPKQAVAAPPGRALRWRLAAASWRGTAVAVATVAVPGLSPGVGAAAVYGRRQDDARPALAALAATGAAHQVLAVGLLFVTMHARTGLAAAVGALEPVVPWTAGRPPAALLDLLLASCVAALGACAAVRVLDGPFARLAARVPSRALAVAALATLACLVGALTGAWGLAALAAATTVGLLPLAARVRRVHLVAAVALPIVAARLGLTP